MSLLPPRGPLPPIATPEKYLSSFEAVKALGIYEAVCVYHGDNAVWMAGDYSNFVNRWNKGKFKDAVKTKLRTMKHKDRVLVLRVE